MILVKSDRTNQKKYKVRKFDLNTDFEPEDLKFVDDSAIPANTLYKMCDEHIESLNKRLERCRLLQRAIECAFNRNAQELIPNNSQPLQKGRVKGHFVQSIDASNGIFIH